MTKRILLGITGSIGVINMPAYLMVLKNHFDDVHVVLSHTAQKFLPKETFLLFTPNIHTNLFESAQNGFNHVELAQSSDIFLILPASGNIIGQAANGLASCMLSTIMLAYENPLHFFPNMNQTMWNNKALQRNVKTLQDDGHYFVRGEGGQSITYATGKNESKDHLPLPQQIVKYINDELSLHAANV